MTNVTIEGANIGVVNTGTIGHVQKAVGFIQQAGNAPLADAFKSLTESVIAARDATIEQKQEIIELLGVLSREATEPPEKRSRLTMRKLLAEAVGLINSIGSLVQAGDKLVPIIKTAFD